MGLLRSYSTRLFEVHVHQPHPWLMSAVLLNKIITVAPPSWIRSFVHSYYLHGLNHLVPQPKPWINLSLRWFFMDFCMGRSSACSCPQCDQEPTLQLAAGHVGNKFSAANCLVVSHHVSMTESSNSYYPKGSIRSRRYGSSLALQGHVENESVTSAPTSLAWGDGGHRCRSFPCPICHGRACN